MVNAQFGNVVVANLSPAEHWLARLLPESVVNALCNNMIEQGQIIINIIILGVSPHKTQQRQFNGEFLSTLINT